MANPEATRQNVGTNRILGAIEAIGNRLPSPVMLFLLGTVLVMTLSHCAMTWDWTVMKLEPRVGENGNVKWDRGDEQLSAKSLLTSDGIHWLLSHMVINFVNFPPLGVVLVGMLGIGVAEATGLMKAAIKALMLITPQRLLTPTVVFVGVMSSMTLDAGYVVLPALAAVLFQAAGRSPLAGIAASFAGVSAGFAANLFVTALDPMLARLSTIGAQVVAPEYEVAATCNLWFMIVSTITMTLTGWAVTAWFVERRLQMKTSTAAGLPPQDVNADRSPGLSVSERRGLRDAAISFFLVVGVFIAMSTVEGWPLFGMGSHFDRWVESMVPLIFFAFLIPGIVYGVRAGTVKGEKDVADLMTKSMATMAPIIVLSFAAAQFIESFKYSNLDRMLAMAGGQMLVTADLSPIVLILAFILLTLFFNLFVGSMSAKYSMFAPIFVPMLMVVGISPELTQAAYRIGDSVSNVITPLNPYLIIVLVLYQKYDQRSGMGTLIATMVPYTLGFTMVWTVQLTVWMLLGVPLGVAGPLEYAP